MSTLKIMSAMGNRMLREELKIRGVKPRAGHTVIEYEPRTAEAETAASVFNQLVTLYHFTALDTTIPEAPVRIQTFDPDAQPQSEVVLIPQIAGGC